MAKRTATLSISIPVDLVQALYQKVRDGHHASDDAVVIEALRRYLMPDVADVTPAPTNPTEKRRTRGSKGDSSRG